MFDILIPTELLILTRFSLLYFSTLYCAKGNYEFGISRIMKSLEPYNKKVGSSSCFLFCTGLCTAKDCEWCLFFQSHRWCSEERNTGACEREKLPFLNSHFEFLSRSRRTFKKGERKVEKQRSWRSCDTHMLQRTRSPHMVFITRRGFHFIRFNRMFITAEFHTLYCPFL